MDYFRKVDIFGQEIGFEENQSSKFKSVQGAIFTSIVIIVCSVICFLFGQEVYLRKQANVRFSKKLIEPVSTLISVNENPFIFSIVDKFGRLLTNPDDYITVSLTQYTILQNATTTIKPFSLTSNCTYDKIPNFQSFFNNSYCNKGGCFCPDSSKDIKFKNDYANPDSIFLNLAFLPCDKTKKTCAKDMDDVLKNFGMLVTIINSYVETDNYEIPIKYYVTNLTYQASRGLYKRIFVSMTNNTFTSDNGWLLEELNEIRYAQISEVKTEILVYTEGATPIGAFTFSSPRLVDNIIRSYMKVQDLTAKIGGLINAMIIIVKILSFSYLRFIYVKEIYNITKVVEKKESRIKNNNSSSMTQLKLNNYTNPNIKKANEGMPEINTKKEKENKENGPKIVHASNNALNLANMNKKVLTIVEPVKPEDEEINFNYFRYLKSFTFRGTYYKQVDIRLNQILAKMNIETYAKAMNFFYTTG